jgi:hypothetical protein
MNNETNRMVDIHQISPEALAVLGGGKLAYVKTIRSEDVQKHFPQAPELAAGSRMTRPGSIFTAASRRVSSSGPLCWLKALKSWERT